MRTLGIHKNIPVSGTKLTLALPVGFISSHLTADKLFPVNPRAILTPPKMSLLIDAKSMPSLIIKPRLILCAHTDNFGWNKTSNQQQQMLMQNLNRIVSRPNVTTGHILDCITNCISINLMFMENFSTNTQVWNILRYRNDCRQRGVIRVTYGCYRATTETRTRSGTSGIIRSSVPPRALVGPTTN